MMSADNVYFIAIIPPVKICEEVTAFKQDIADRFESKAALKVIPHITLKAPFKLPSASQHETLDWFKELPLTVSPFVQELNSFGAFSNPRHPVIYVKPIMNLHLNNLQKELLLNFQQAFPEQAILELELKYKPHVTIAYRDLAPKFFKEAWKEFQTKEYFAAFEVNDLHLLQHDGRRWNTISTYGLSNRLKEQ